MTPEQIIFAALLYSLEERVRLEYEVARLKMKERK
jgi:chorismate mutase